MITHIAVDEADATRLEGSDCGSGHLVKSGSARGPKSCYKPLMVGWDCRGRKELVFGDWGPTFREPGNISHREGGL